MKVIRGRFTEAHLEKMRLAFQKFFPKIDSLRERLGSGNFRRKMEGVPHRVREGMARNRDAAGNEANGPVAK